MLSAAEVVGYGVKSCTKRFDVFYFCWELCRTLAHSAGFMHGLRSPLTHHIFKGPLIFSFNLKNFWMMSCWDAHYSDDGKGNGTPYKFSSVLLPAPQQYWTGSFVKFAELIRPKITRNLLPPDVAHFNGPTASILTGGRRPPQMVCSPPSTAAPCPSKII